jgi:hypothetical protein
VRWHWPLRWSLGSQLRKGAAEVEAAAAEVVAVQEVPVARELPAQAPEPVVRAPQAERVKVRQPGGPNKDQALEALAREEDLRTLAGRVIPLMRQTGLFRDGPRHKFRLQHPERTGSTA